MFIEEVILDGFKSYGPRTVVSGFDPAFNAITGLNGSGKSNILDAICFVLGISNLSQVRVASLQELVYKQGTAGITKASVTIVFNNADSKTSPVGYEQYDKITVTRQVVIGGRNKYLINGHTAQLNRVQNLFHSVQLNVNNPHFLIMQGRITKVLNMKPPEILAMIEEAAGTRMFETKKTLALKTLEKKQKKVDEISKILSEDITPTLEKLRKERTEYIQWKTNQTECERLQRFVIAYRYSYNVEILRAAAGEAEQLQRRSSSLNDNLNQADQEMLSIKTQIAELTAAKDAEMQNQFRQLESESRELSTQLVKQTATCQHKTESLNDARKQRTRLLATEDEGKNAVAQKEADLADAQKLLDNADASHGELAARLQQQQQQYQAIQAGVSATDGSQTAALSDQLQEAKRAVGNAATEAKRLQMRLKHVDTELVAQRASAGSASKEFQALEQARERAVAARDESKERLDATAGQAESHRSMQAQKRELLDAYNKVSDRVNRLSAQLAHCSFDVDLGGNRVKGLVANMMEVPDAKNFTALEVTAGGRLFNVIVDTETTGKELLSSGRLKNRITIVPLNRINSSTMPPHVVSSAARVAGAENVALALDLVQYKKEVEPAMKWVFGNTLVCTDSSSAEKVAYHQDVRARSVTLEGDVFDSNGTISGGSRDRGNALLMRLQELTAARRELDHTSGRLYELDQQLAASASAAAAHERDRQQLEIKNHEIELIQTRLSANSHYQILEKVRELEQQQESDKAQLTSSAEQEQQALQRCGELESLIARFESGRGDQLKAISAEIQSLKVKQGESSKKLKVRQQAVEKLRLELHELRLELTSTAEQLASLGASILRLQDEVGKEEETVLKVKQELDTVNTQLEERRLRVAQQSQQIGKLIAQRESALKRSTEIKLELQKLEIKAAKQLKEKQETQRHVDATLKRHEWIRMEEQNFGKPQTDYDFKSRVPAKVEKHLEALNQEQERLSRCINKKVLTMFEKAEQEYQDLQGKRSIVEKDKSQIERAIEALDHKKNDALQTTWHKVNRDFGSIFSTLLPGASAKLEPPEGMSVLDGLEVKVAFSGIWKQLTELSGGQRSLIALSLILSLLLFKPAPMYILDEIDAALDPSHTQNIGQMLRTHFTHSQFIVVSLKEGMFNNASVLFRTKFEKGVSQVTRHVNKPAVLPTGKH